MKQKNKQVADDGFQVLEKEKKKSEPENPTPEKKGQGV